MALARCPVCEAEVEAVDGSCLLGHAVPAPAIAPGVASRLDELRAEVERAFDDAARKVEAALTGEVPLVPKHEAVVPLQRQATKPLRVDTPVLPGSPFAASPPRSEATQAPTTWQAPSAAAPPPPPSRRLDVASMWQKANQPGNDDPINAFAPAPRLDWGPEAKKRLRRRIEG